MEPVPVHSQILHLINLRTFSNQARQVKEFYPELTKGQPKGFYIFEVQG